jgi:hypothetical protein
MKCTKARQISFVFILLFITVNLHAIPHTRAWQTSFKMENLSSRSYVVPLNQSEIFYTEVTALYFGHFELYIIGERPKMNFVLADGSIEPWLLENALASNTTSSGPLEYDDEIKMKYGNITNSYQNRTTLEFQAPWNGLFYLIIVLRQGGPDFFYMNSSHEMNPYFIPFIPGYPLEVVISVVSIFTFLIIRKVRKSLRNLSL